MRHTRTLWTGLGAALASLLLTVAAPTAGQATSPGANGRIAFTSNLHGSWQMVRTSRPYSCSARASEFCRLLACSLAMSRLAVVCPNSMEPTRRSRSFQWSAISWVWMGWVSSAPACG